MDPTPDAETARFEEAVRWLTRRGVNGFGSEEEEAQFQQWLKKDAHNPLAWRSANEVYDQMGAAKGWEMAPEQPSPAPSPGKTRRLLLPLAALAPLLILSAVGLGWWSHSAAREIYRTGPGERQEVTLADGSVAELDSGALLISRIRDRGQRSVELRYGRIILDVEPDSTRPFVVAAAGARVRVTGTQFEVAHRDQGVDVAVLEGSVEVASGAGSSGASRLSDLQQVSVAPDGSRSAVHTISVEQFASWQDGVIEFADQPLKEVLSEVERYTGKDIVLNDTSLSSIAVSGSFSTGDPMEFLRALPYIAPVNVVIEGEDRVSIRRKPVLPR